LHLGASIVQRLVTAPVPNRRYNGTIVPMSLSIKHVPDDVVERLRQRAERNKRSLQCELLDVIERAADESDSPVLTLRAIYERGKARGLTPKNESARIVRRMRDDRSRHLDRVLEKARGRR
jgi:antitoxin FitA